MLNDGLKLGDRGADSGIRWVSGAGVAELQLKTTALLAWCLHSPHSAPLQPSCRRLQPQTGTALAVKLERPAAVFERCPPLEKRLAEAVHQGVVSGERTLM